MSGIIILDNGASTLKVGRDKSDISVLQNGIFKSKTDRRKHFISSEINTCKDFSSLFYLLPFQKGYLLNWDVQRQVWDYIFGKDVLNLKCNDTGIVVTEPHFNFASIQESMNEIFFEEYEFQKIIRTNSTTLSSHQYSSENPYEDCCLIIDSGYSFTHIVPYYKNQKLADAVCRLDVGGKLLTNHLKEIISFRQLQVMDETYVINQMKEDTCYVSMDFKKDMLVSGLKGEENTVSRDYILPDFTKIHRGYVKPRENSTLSGQKLKSQEQVVRLTHERFSVPEILFHPSDIGVDQMGLAEAILYSVAKCPEEHQPHMLRNIVLTGGNFRFPSIKERLEREVRLLAPDHLEVFITLPDEPITHACRGGVTWAHSSIGDHWVTLEEYQEHGHNACVKKFQDI